jgi:hypothetical protein
MSNEKEIIKKLIRIAENQQKIINKLAEEVGMPAAEPLAGGAASGGGVEGGNDPNKKAEGVCKANLAKLPGFKLQSVTVSGMEGNKPVVAITGSGASEAAVKGMCVEYFLNQLKIPQFQVSVG